MKRDLPPVHPSCSWEWTLLLLSDELPSSFRAPPRGWVPLTPSGPALPELQGEGLQAAPLQEEASHPLLSVSPEAMRCHVATGCPVLWLLLLVSGCWGKSGLPLTPSPSREARLEGAGASGLALPGDPGEPPLLCATEDTFLSGPQLPSAARTRLKIPAVPRAWDRDVGGALRDASAL